MKLWGGRFGKDTDALVNEFNASIQFDQRLYAADIHGSIVHAEMLGHQGIIPKEDADAIIAGLKGILADAEAGKIEFTPENEDIHMNVEALLTARIGNAGKRLHTARSRNDQVALISGCTSAVKSERSLTAFWSWKRCSAGGRGNIRPPSCRGIRTCSEHSRSPLPTICLPTPPCSAGT